MAPEAGTGCGATVVLLEDDPQQLELLRRVLSRRRPAWRLRPLLATRAVTTALRNGDQAPLGPPPGVILADYNLGGVSVVELLGAGLAGLGWSVLVIAGDHRADQEAACLAAGAAGYLAKPLDLDETEGLSTAVDRLLAGVG